MQLKYQQQNIKINSSNDGKYGYHSRIELRRQSRPSQSSALAQSPFQTKRAMQCNAGGLAVSMYLKYSSMYRQTTPTRTNVIPSNHIKSSSTVRSTGINSYNVYSLYGRPAIRPLQHIPPKLELRLVQPNVPVRVVVVQRQAALLVREHALSAGSIHDVVRGQQRRAPVVM